MSPSSRLAPKKKPTAPVAVLGAGPAGLGAALRLQEKGIPVILIDRLPFAGGAGATQRINGCLVDYGPHLFHPSTPEITALYKKYSKGGYITGTMVNQMYLHGKFMRFPFGLQEALIKLSPVLNARILLDYLYVKGKNAVRPQKLRTFEDWGVNSYGRTLYNLCFGDFTARVWARSPKLISAKLAKEKLSAVSLRKVLMNLVLRRSYEGYAGVREYGYHKNGIGSVYDAMVADLRDKGAAVRFNTSVVGFEVEKQGVTSVVVRTAKSTESLAVSAVISTIPLNALCIGLGSKAMRAHAQELEYRDNLFVNFVIRNSPFKDAHMIYLLDKEFSASRLTVANNATRNASPKGTTLVTLELPTPVNSAEWNDDTVALSRVEPDLIRLGVQRKDIVSSFVVRYPAAYPVFRVGFETHLDAIKQYVSSHANLYTTGRQGLFLNTDMHDSFLLGRMAVDHFASGGSAEEWIKKANDFQMLLKF